MKTHIEISYPVLSLQMLDAASGGDFSKYGGSFYEGIFLIWDEDYDTRLTLLARQLVHDGNGLPLSIHERKGSVTLLWPDKLEAMWQEEGYTVDGDWWNAENMFLDTEGKATQFEPEQEP